MESKRIINIVVYSVAALAILIFLWWIYIDPTRDYKVSQPGADNRGKGVAAQPVEIGSIFEKYSDGFTEMSESWPRFRGADFDNISKSPVKLKEKFGSTGPKIVWSVELGEGHSGASIYKGLAYILDYNEQNRADMLRCFSLADGKEIWARGYKLFVKRNHGMSRTIPAITENYILTMGPMCHVMCLNRKDGSMLWGLDIAKEYESEVPLWYTGQCPLIDNNLAILATGGKALMVAIDCATGQKIWETPNPKGWKMSHSSVMPFTFSGRKMYVYSAAGGMVGIAADGPDAGKVLWETPAWNHSVVAPSPVCMPDGKIYITAGYGAGAMMLQLKESAGKFNIEVLDEYLPKDGLASEQQTPILWQGHLFGIMPKDGGTMRNQLICVNPSNPKKPVWTSGQENRFGLGPYFMADGKLFILNDDATITIAKPSTSKYIQLEQVKILEDGQDAWAPFALANGYLLMRDSKKMVCIDLNL
jgi:outer membrane protein assembly factor BamB